MAYLLLLKHSSLFQDDINFTFTCWKMYAEVCLHDIAINKRIAVSRHFNHFDVEIPVFQSMRQIRDIYNYCFDGGKTCFGIGFGIEVNIYKSGKSCAFNEAT